MQDLISLSGHLSCVRSPTWSRSQTPGRCFPLAWQPRGGQPDGVPAPPEGPTSTAASLLCGRSPSWPLGWSPCRRSPAPPGDPALRLWGRQRERRRHVSTSAWVRAWVSRGCGEACALGEAGQPGKHRGPSAAATWMCPGTRALRGGRPATRRGLGHGSATGLSHRGGWVGLPEAPRRQEWVPVRPQAEMAVAETRQGARGRPPHVACPCSPAGPSFW